MIIVQIGTCIGNDDLGDIIKGYGEIELLVLVEPMSIHNDKILNFYKSVKNKVIKNVVILTEEDRKTTTFFYHKNDGPLYEVASLDKTHITKHGFDLDGIVELNVECMTINSLFNELNLNQVDILFIDTEGWDDSIIKSIDYDKFNIESIYFENLHLKDINVYDFLRSKGYQITEKTGTNGWNSLAKFNGIK